MRARKRSSLDTVAYWKAVTQTNATMEDIEMRHKTEGQRFVLANEPTVMWKNMAAIPPEASRIPDKVLPVMATQPATNNHSQL